MGQYDSKYDVIIEILKRYNIYDDLWDGMVTSKYSQVKKIYNICHDIISIDNIIDLIPIKYHWGFSNEMKYGITFNINDIKFTLYFEHKNNSSYIVIGKMKNCFIEIIFKMNERRKQTIKDFSYFPNDIKWLICEYI